MSQAGRPSPRSVAMTFRTSRAVRSAVRPTVAVLGVLLLPSALWLVAAAAAAGDEPVCWGAEEDLGFSDASGADMSSTPPPTEIVVVPPQ